METKLEKTENTSELRYLTPVEMEVKSGKKYCRFKKMKIKYIYMVTRSTYYILLQLKKYHMVHRLQSFLSLGL